MKPEDMDKIWPEMASNYTRGYEGEGWEDRPVTFVLTENGKREISRSRKRDKVIAWIITIILIGISYYAYFVLGLFR